MRVLFTTAWYPNRKVAGDGVFIQKHARAVSRLDDVAVLMVQTDEQKHDLRIEVCPPPAAVASVACGEARVDSESPRVESEKLSMDSESPHPPFEVCVYVPKTRFELPVVTGLLRLFWLMAGYVKGYRYIKRVHWQGQRPEVCHVNVLTRAAGLPWLLKRLHGIPYIVTEHWSRYLRAGAYPDSSLQLRLGRRFVRDASYVCPVSLNLEQAMQRWQLRNPHYTRVGNVVDTDVFTLPEPAAASSDEQAVITRFVHVSWMRDDTKNISGILRVLARLAERRQDFHLRLIGEGNDKPVLIALSQQLGLDAHVTFVEARQGAALAQELRESDALLMFSHTENQPVSVLEALSCGLPVIATAVGAIPGMLAQNRGLTVAPGDEETLLTVLDGFLTLRAGMTPAQRADQSLARQRREYVVCRHSPDVIARQFDALYRSARAANG